MHRSCKDEQTTIGRDAVKYHFAGLFVLRMTVVDEAQRKKWAASRFGGRKTSEADVLRPSDYRAQSHQTTHSRD